MGRKKKSQSFDPPMTRQAQSLLSKQVLQGAKSPLGITSCATPQTTPRGVTMEVQDVIEAMNHIFTTDRQKQAGNRAHKVMNVQVTVPLADNIVPLISPVAMTENPHEDDIEIEDLDEHEGEGGHVGNDAEVLGA